ncbi:hypothetical protein [Propionicicella superfundia]|uniref:hypothetical protein n=1 Tax=Propionicicella superfundia TaxID=348582 RepID=UPI0004116453|nr:hypothetical protein [Propionicicella superfundia]
MTRPRRAERRAASATAVTMSAIVVLAVAVAAVAAAVGLYVLISNAAREATAIDQCTAATSDHTATLTPDQAHYASIIVGLSVKRGLPERAATVAIATAYQESKIANLDYGDRDSVGLFQQRPSQGWGTAEEIMDPVYSTNAFYDALVKVTGWQQMEITEAAQAVQRSAYPNAYAQHEDDARAVAAALTGQTQRSLTCLDRVEVTADASSLGEFLTTVFGTRVTIATSGQEIRITPANAQIGWAVAHAVAANYARYGVTGVSLEQSSWTPADAALGTWADAAEAVTGVVVTRAG